MHSSISHLCPYVQNLFLPPPSQPTQCGPSSFILSTSVCAKHFKDKDKLENELSKIPDLVELTLYSVEIRLPIFLINCILFHM